MLSCAKYIQHLMREYDMKIISEQSLTCFLHDLRSILAFFKGHMPHNIKFINVESFYFYMRLGFPNKFKEMRGLMDIVEPYIPLVISQKNLEDVVFAYEQGNLTELAEMEDFFSKRSKLVFINSVMEANEVDFSNIVSICRRIRSLKSEAVFF